MLEKQRDQIERRETLRNDLLVRRQQEPRVFAENQSQPREASTLHQHAQAQANEIGGRFSAVAASWAADADRCQQQHPLGRQLPKDIGAHELLQMVYRGEIAVTQQQMQAARESIAYEKPKLTAVAHIEGSFAEALEREIEKRVGRPPPSLLIEAKPVEPLPASELKAPLPRMKRRV